MKKILLFALFVLAFLPHAFAADISNVDRILAQKEIKCGYAVWSPVLYVDANTGEINGITKDVMDAIGKKLDLKINWAEEAGWGSIVEGLATKRYDMICVGLGPVPNRAKAVDFTNALLYLPIYAIARTDDTRFDKNLDALNDPSVNVGVLEGEFTSILANEKFPKAHQVAIPQISDLSMLMEDIKTKKTDLSFITAETYDAYNKKNPGVLKIANANKPLSVLGISLGVPRGDFAFKRLIDLTLDDLYADGTIAKILNKYDPEGKIFFLRQTPYAQ